MKYNPLKEVVSYVGKALARFDGLTFGKMERERVKNPLPTCLSQKPKIQTHTHRLRSRAFWICATYRNVCVCVSKKKPLHYDGKQMREICFLPGED